jgi:predicted RNA binding protein YcfA (HicA-like mRNA interferase family)
VIPFHSGKIFHPKIVKQVVEAIETDEEENTENED